MATPPSTLTGSLLALVEKDKKKAGPQLPQPSAQPRPENQPLSPGAVAMPDMTKMMEEMRKDPKKMQEQMKKMQEQAKKMQEAMQKGDMSAVGTMMESMGVSVPGLKPAGPANNLRIIDVATGRQLQTIPLPGGLFGQLVGDSPFASTAVSFSPDGRVLASSQMARLAGAPIHLLRVIDLVQLPWYGNVAAAMDYATVQSAITDEVNAASAYLQEVAGRLSDAGVTVTTESRQGRVTREIVDAAKPGDLLVMASQAAAASRAGCWAAWPRTCCATPRCPCCSCGRMNRSSTALGTERSE